MNQSAKFWALVPAAGVGQRMNADRPKQYLPLLGKTVIEQTVQRLLQAELFSAVSVAVSAEDPYWPELPVARHEKIITAAGGKERADSVLSALRAIEKMADDNDWVLVHDAARPCLTVSDIHLLVARLGADRVGGLLALASHDTLKQVQGNVVTGTLNRHSVYRALTPQMFRYGLLRQALVQSQGNRAVTDEASALELQGWRPKIIEGRPDNIKITRPEDLVLAQFYLEQQQCLG